MVRFSASDLFTFDDMNVAVDHLTSESNNDYNSSNDDEEDTEPNIIDQAIIPIQIQSQKKKKRNKKKKKKKEIQIIYEIPELESAPVESIVVSIPEQLIDSVRFNFPIIHSKKLMWKDVIPEQITTYQVDPMYISDVKNISFNYERLCEVRQKTFKYVYNNFSNALEELVKIPRFKEKVTVRKHNPSCVTPLLSQQQRIGRMIYSCVSNNLTYILEKKEDMLHLLIYDCETGHLVEYLNLEKLFFLNGNDGMVNLDMEFDSDFKIAKFESDLFIFCGNHSISDSEYYAQADIEREIRGINWKLHQNKLVDEMLIYKISNVDHPNKISILPYFYFDRSTSKKTCDYLTKRSGYSVNSTNDIIYIFGGMEKKNRTLSNALFKISKNDSNGKAECKLKYELCAPCPRTNHSSCVISTDLYVYGGMAEKGRLLNDLYTFNGKLWSEIIIDSLLPSPKADCYLLSDSRHLYLFQNSDTYCLDVYGKNPTWKILNGFTKEQDKLDKNPIKIETLNNFLELTDSGFKSCPRHLLNYCSHDNLPQFLMKKRNGYYMVDVAFKLEDSLNDLSDYILAHTCVIMARCPRLFKFIEETNQVLEKDEFVGVTFPNDNKSTIPLVRVLPGFEPVFKTYLDFLYCGEIDVKGAKDIPILLELARILSPECHFPFFLKLFDKKNKIDMSQCKQAIREYYRDFENFFKHGTGSDLALVFPDSHPNIELDEFGMVANQETIPDGALNVHRLFLSRSPYLSSVFVTSRMSEALSKTVYMEDYSHDAFRKLVEYFYTDKIQLDGQNCLATIMYSSLFECDDLLSCARSIASEFINHSTIWDVMGIAEHSQDAGLLDACKNYIINNETLLQTSEFSNLPIITQSIIKDTYHNKMNYVNKKKKK